MNKIIGALVCFLILSAPLVGIAQCSEDYRDYFTTLQSGVPNSWNQVQTLPLKIPHSDVSQTYLWALDFFPDLNGTCIDDMRAYSSCYDFAPVTLRPYLGLAYSGTYAVKIEFLPTISYGPYEFKVEYREVDFSFGGCIDRSWEVKMQGTVCRLAGEQDFPACIELLGIDETTQAPFPTCDLDDFDGYYGDANPITVLADAIGTGVLDPQLNEHDYCGTITGYKYRVFKQDDAGAMVLIADYQASWIPVTDNNNGSIAMNDIDLNGYGIYDVEFILQSEDGMGGYTEHTNNGTPYPIRNIHVIPSCADGAAFAPIVSAGTGTSNLLTGNPEGSTVEEVFGGYSSPEIQYDPANGDLSQFGGYIVEAGKYFTIDFGNIVDFTTHYDIIVNDGSVFDAPDNRSGLVDFAHVPGTEAKFQFSVDDRVTIGAFGIHARKKDYLGDFCASDEYAVQIFVGGSNVVVPDQPCLIVLPSDIPDIFPNVLSDFGQEYTAEHFKYYVSSYQGVVVEPHMRLTAGAQLAVRELWKPAPEEQVDNDKNWVHTVAYDDFGNVISESKSFFGDNGQNLQTQSKNLADGYVIAEQPLRDEYGRASLSSLPAPVRGRNNYGGLNTAVKDCGDDIAVGKDMVFLYAQNFISRQTSAKPTTIRPYNHTDFADNRLGNPRVVYDGTVSAASGGVDAPSAQYNLGWYYSSNNTIESHVAETDFPFSQVEYEEDGTNEMRSSVPPGNVYRSQTGHQNISTSQVSAVTTADVATIRYLIIWDEVFSAGTRPVFINNATISEVTDPQGQTTRNYTNQKGQTVISYHLQSGDMSFNYFNEQDQLVATISPNGVEQFANQGISYDNIDKTTMRYDFRGRLISSTSNDAGTSTFKYRKDGAIRFSQNAEQAVTGAYSYTNYDVKGRPTESGEFVPSGALTFSSITNTSPILERRQNNDGLNGNGTKQNVLRTYYDVKDAAAPIAQEFVRGKVSHTVKDEGTTQETQTWYSYDERGRITQLAKSSALLGDVKTIHYYYGPAGEVRLVIYEKDNAAERFVHYYQYDFDKRLRRVYTATIDFTDDELVFGDLTKDHLYDLHLEAEYTYYAHGPLKRVETAEGAQGMDYVYTVEGWLKSLNHPELSTVNDPGADGTGFSKPDLFGMSLDYYSGDYTRLNVDMPSNAVANNYSGIIDNAKWKADGMSNTVMYDYTYDNKYQLGSATFGTYTSSTFTPNAGDYKVWNLGYDRNGNIQSLHRNYEAGGKAPDLLAYNYTDVNGKKANRLDGVQSSGSAFATSYTYNRIGQMTRQTDTENANDFFVQYDVYGKATGVFADAGHTQPLVEFVYDDNGYRAAKRTFDVSTFTLVSTTHYMRDNAGQVMAIYTEPAAGVATQVEVPVYGTGRLATRYPNDGSNPGIRVYDVKDHLGNVRARYSNDYTTSNVATYDFNNSFDGWTILENGNAAQPVLGTGLASAIKLELTSTSTYNVVFYSPDIAVTPNTTYRLTYDVTNHLGGETNLTLTVDGAEIYTENFLENGVQYLRFTTPSTASNLVITFERDKLKTKTGKFDLTFTDIILDEVNYNFTVHSKMDYYPFGMKLPYSLASSFGERHDYQSDFSEKDEETGWNAFELRMYDSRIGRWLSTDPYNQFASPYLGMGNNPISGIDKDGGWLDEWRLNTETGDVQHMSDRGGATTQYIYFNDNTTADVVVESQNYEWYYGPAALDYEGNFQYTASAYDLWSDVPDQYLGHYDAFDLVERYRAASNPKTDMKIKSIRTQEQMGLDRRDMIWNAGDYGRYLEGKYGNKSAFIMAADLDMMPMPGGVRSGLKRVHSALSKGIKPNIAQFKYTPRGIQSTNPWIRFLQNNRGRFKGSNWLNEARNEYFGR